MTTSGTRAPQGEQAHSTTSGILRKLTTSGPLTTRILNSGKLDSGKLDEHQK